MYGEDLDLSLRLRLAGWGVGVAPAARVAHDYEFAKGDYKWFYLERNRWWTVLGAYPGVLLAALAPALLAFEVVLLSLAWRGGWLRAKLRAQAAVLRELPAMCARRRGGAGDAAVSRRRVRRAGLSASLDSPQPRRRRRRSRGLRRCRSAYWRVRVRPRRGRRAGGVRARPARRTDLTTSPRAPRPGPTATAGTATSRSVSIALPEALVRDRPRSWSSVASCSSVSASKLVASPVDVVEDLRLEHHEAAVDPALAHLRLLGEVRRRRPRRRPGRRSAPAGAPRDVASLPCARWNASSGVEVDVRDAVAVGEHERARRASQVAQALDAAAGVRVLAGVDEVHGPVLAVLVRTA